MTGARRGSITAGTWLIGLGVVFLIREVANVPWGEAWPLFLILVGVAGVVSTAMSWRPSLAGIWSFTWPVVWIGTGAILLASTTGNLVQGPVEFFGEWWPWLAVGLGVWFMVGAIAPGGGRPEEHLALPLAGATSASVRLTFGAGKLAVSTAAPGNLVDGTFAGGVVRKSDGPGRIDLSQDTTFGLPWLDHGSEWTVGLTRDVPLDLRVDAGAARTDLDLSELLLRRLEIRTGASETHIRLPRNAGATDVKAETGAASLTMNVPVGVAARIRLRMALGSSDVDEARFPRTSSGYESPDFGTATNRVDIDVQGGVGSVRILGE